MAKRKVIEVFADAATASYRKAYAAFERSARLAGADLAPLRPGGECFETKLGSGSHTSVEVFGALKIERLPKRRRESNQPNSQDIVSVLMSSKEIYFFGGRPALDNSFLAESFVSVSYYEPRRTGWKTLLSVRYDYSCRGARGGHPIFHAQMGDGSPGENMAKLAGMPSNIKLLEDHYEGVRLPTANMIGATALLKLAADHLPHRSFTPVLRSIQALSFFRNWRCNCETLDDVDSPRDMLSVGWYGCKAM
jgi:hypothetical protein